MLDRLYAQAARTRRRWYERHPEARRVLTRPVISIGNLTVGGTGKTPLVSQLVAWLVARGERPAVLSRGYLRRIRRDGAVVVSDGARILADLDSAGDEPLMLARAHPSAVVVVAEDRHLAGALAERRLGATVHVLDDGFQHVQLARNLDVLMVAHGEVTNARVLPFGRLREAPDAAARAQLLVVVGGDLAAAREEAWKLGISQAVSAKRTLAPLKPPGDEKVLAVAGIAEPEQFFEMLRAAGYSIAKTIPFSDHHRFTTADISRIRSAAREAGATAVVTTEKDGVRFEAHAPLPFTCVTVPMTLEIDPWETVTSLVEAALDRARERA